MLSFQELLISLEIGLIYGIVAIGIYLTFRTINFPDLTCDGSFVLGAAVSSIMIKSNYDPYLAIAFSMITGGVSGFFTGILNTWFKIEDLLSGIIVAFMLYSVNLRVMGMIPNITFTNEITIFSGENSLLKILLIVSLLVAFFVYILNTDFGLGLRAIGKNRQFAIVCGINVNTMIIIGLIASNAMVGLCGAVFTQYQGFCDVSQGIGTLVIGLASVIIGERILNFKSVLWSIPACIIGSVMYRIFIACAIHSDIMGLKTQDLNFVTGIVVIVIMASRKRGCYN